MSEGLDDRIGERLRQAAPAAHDPAFRISVLERRERKRFLQQSAWLGAVGLMLALIALAGIAIGGVAATVAVPLATIAALGVAYLRYEPVVTQLIERIRF